MSFQRMTFKERMDIFKMFHVKHLSKTKIAKELNRSASSISREIKRGKDSDSYNPFVAELDHLQRRRYQSPKLKIDAVRWNLIKPKLEMRWSPDQVAKWLKKEYPHKSMSGKTIYNYVHFHMRGELKKVALKDLRQRGKKRKTSSLGEKRGKLQGMTLIDERPVEVAAREVPGHWEGDLIIGKNHKSAICVIVERKTRFVQLDLLYEYNAPIVRKTIERRFRQMAPHLRKTLTLDQGKENGEHQILSENMKIGVYFCHPSSPWEKGTCENTNGLVRDMLYEIDDFRTLKQRDVSRIARLLNERPRQTLDYRTPKEVLAELR